MNIDATVRLCRTHKLYSALINVYNRAMIDYTTPIDVLLVTASEPPAAPPSSRAAGGGAGAGAGSGDGEEEGRSRAGSIVALVATTPVRCLLFGLFCRRCCCYILTSKCHQQTEQRRMGYKLLLYIQYCLTGRAFPRGDLPPEVANTLRANVLSFVFEYDPPK